MDRVAFFAPLKPPEHPVPSGDREMARNLMHAIGARGARVELVSDLRIYDGCGDRDIQATLFDAADKEARRLIKHLSSTGVGLWVTYHNYYKAPDLVGPTVCEALDLPYVQIESTRAKSRLTGPWGRFAEAAEKASDQAGIIFYLTALDLITLERDRAPAQSLVHLKPFLPIRELPIAANPVAPRPMLSVGMMRAGDKLASYKIIAETLARLQVPAWQLDIAGDGPARAQVEELMAPFGDRVRFLGQLSRHDLERAYAGASVFFWPGVNEAYGMVYLEAQAAGLPVIAQDRPGVRDVVLAGDLPSPGAGPQALAHAIDEMLNAPGQRSALGRAGCDRVAQAHLIDAATDTFWSAIDSLGGVRA